MGKKKAKKKAIHRRSVDLFELAREPMRAVRAFLPTARIDETFGLKVPTTPKRSPPKRKVKAPPAIGFASGLKEAISIDPSLHQRAIELTENVTFSVATTTRGGEPLQSFRGRAYDADLQSTRPDEAARDQAIEQLAKLGFRILHRGRFATTVSGPASLVRDILGAPLVMMRQATPAASRAARAFAAETLPPQPEELFLAPADSLSVRATQISSQIDHFVFAPPAVLFTSSTPPPLTYHHLTPADVRRILNVPASGAHAGLTGTGVRVGIVDSGFDTSHPFYTNAGALISAHASPGGPPGQQDLDGHGTAMASNILAIAPSAEVKGVRQFHPPYQDALEFAVDTLQVDILSCSWGWPGEQSWPSLELTLRSIIEEDHKIVLFAAGNGQYAWPASMPEVIAIGGVYSDVTGQLEASDFASGFVSSLYPPRQVPDVCGLCGQAPLGIYLPMPCPIGSAHDRKYAGTPFPDRDTTHPADGWVVASGTSAATPQIAGAVALLFEAARTVGNVVEAAKAKDLLQRSARAITRGRNAQGFPATAAQPNGAVGWGLVDVEKLLQLAHSDGLI